MSVPPEMAHRNAPFRYAPTQNTGRTEKARQPYERLITLNPFDVAGVGSEPDLEGKSLVDIAKENPQKLK